MSNVMDPSDIEKRFSSNDDEEMLSTTSDSLFRFEDFQPFLDRIPRREVDLIEMYYRQDKKQKEIADFFEVTQGAISHRLSRARRRLKFLRDMPKLSSDPRKLLADYFEPFELDLYLYMVETTCQSKTAELLNRAYRLKGRKAMTQIKVRHKFDRYIDRLKNLKRSHSELSGCYKLAVYVKQNLYMLHEVILPHFDRGYRARIRSH
jgi:hypothetical protein